jgi:ATP-dependent exoDNAse (exonuclease V) beta subunit
MAASRRQIKREQEVAGVDLLRIMTVHGAKGLEAPIVILADTVDVPTTQRETVFSVATPSRQPLLALSISSMSKFSTVLGKYVSANVRTGLASHEPEKLREDLVSRPNRSSH